MIIRSFLSILGLALAAVACAGGSAKAYATDTSGSLYLIDLPTATASYIGTHGQFLEGLAMRPDGYMVGTDASGDLFSISAADATPTFLGSTGLGNIEGLSYAGFNLWGTDFNAGATFYNISDSDGSNFGGFSVPGVDTVRAMGFDPTFTYAYVVADSPSFQSLWAIPYGGPGILIGSLSGNVDIVASMDYVGGQFWALDGSGNVYTMDVTTAALSYVGNTGGQFWLDMTAAPVPEPASVVALGLGAAAMLRRRRSK